MLKFLGLTVFASVSSFFTLSAEAATGSAHVVCSTGLMGEGSYAIRLQVPANRILNLAEICGRFSTPSYTLRPESAVRGTFKNAYEWDGGKWIPVVAEFMPGFVTFQNPNMVWAYLAL